MASGVLGAPIRRWLVEKGPMVRRRVLMATVAGIPLFFLRFVNDPFNVPKLALLAMGVGIAAALRGAELLQGTGLRAARRLVIPAAAIGIPLIVAWLFSAYKGWALLGLYGRFQGLIPYLLVILLGALIADAFAGRALELAWAVVIAGAVVAGYAVIQVLGADPFEWILSGIPSNAAISTTGNPNFTGGFLGIVLPVALGVWAYDGPNRPRALKLVVLIAVGWIVARSEGGYAAGLAGCAVVGASLVAHRWRYARVLAGVAVAGIAAALVAVVVVAVAKPELGLPETIRLRGLWWGTAVRMTADQPLAGSGPNAFAMEGLSYRSVEEAVGGAFDYSDDPHSVVLAFGAAAGILGIVGFLALAGWTAREWWSLPEDDWLATGFIGAIAAYLVQSLVSIDELTLRTALWTAIGGLAAARSVGDVSATRKKRATPARRREVAQPLAALPGVGALALVAVVVVAAAGAFLVADGKVLAGRSQFAAGRVDAARPEFEGALGIADLTHYRQIYGVGLGNAAIASAETDPGRAEELIEASERAFSYTVGLPDVYGLRDLGRLLHGYATAAGTPVDPAAADAYLKAVQLDPANPTLLSETAVVLLDMRRYDEVVTLLDRAAETLGSRFNVWGPLALARAHLGDEAGARVAIERALAQSPSDPEALEARELLDGG
ncbi:MAG: O-antigen ligase family protein [Actinomycetota bacterium]|nr:O-antigen ligase family protein [Actinomycetota bacterium]